MLDHDELISRLESRARYRIQIVDTTAFCAPLEGQLEWLAAVAIKDLKDAAAAEKLDLETTIKDLKAEIERLKNWQI